MKHDVFSGGGMGCGYTIDLHGSTILLLKLILNKGECLNTVFQISVAGK